MLLLQPHKRAREPPHHISYQPKERDPHSPRLKSLPPSSVTGNGSGSSCHQCKSRRQLTNLVFCCNMFAKKGKDKKHACRKKYCEICNSSQQHTTT